MSKLNPNKFGAAVGAAVLIIATAATMWAVAHRQTIVDTVRAMQFEPTAEIRAIKQKLVLTDEASLLFDASHPRLLAAKDFNDACGQHSETNSPIIGCYTMQTIFIYDVDTSELDGIEETTAAHELLHGVYERMSDADKAPINRELEKAYERVKTTELEERMAYYEKNQPGEELNELHSILGSEYADLSTILESHYAKYFTSRKKVLSYHDAYDGVFKRVTNQLQTLNEEINTIVEALNQRVRDYNAAVSRLDRDTTSFNERASSGGFSSQAQFDAERAELVSRQRTLDEQKRAIEASITSINGKKETYNALVDKYAALSRSINSSLAPTPSI